MTSTVKTSKPLRIMGIDPGTRIAGFACLEARKPHPTRPEDFKIVTAGVVRLDTSKDHTYRIGQLFDGVRNLVDEVEPDVCVIEKAFCGVNVNSALKLGEARGVLIAALTSRQVKLVQITPAQVKKAIAGNGRATKEEISMALKAHLGFEQGTLPFDASDALALALCHGLAYPLQCDTALHAYGRPLPAPSRR